MRFLRFFLLLVCMVSLTACGSTPSSGHGKTKLTLWYWNRSLSDSLISQVKKKFPNVHLVAQKIGGDFRLKLQTTLVGKSGAPDIVLFNDWIAQYLPYKKEFVNLYNYGAGNIENEYLGWKWNLAEPPGKKKYLIALPIDTGPTALFYRADLFKKAGLPTDPKVLAKRLHTWKDYINAGVQLKKKTHAYMVDSITNVYNQILGQSAKKLFDKNNHYIGDGPSNKRAWDIAVKFNKLGLNAKIPGGTDWNAAVDNGKIASFVNAVWEKQILEDAAPDTKGKWHVTRAPGGAGNVGGSFIGIMASSKHKKKAYQVIKWMMSPKNQLKDYLDVNLFPSAKAALNNPKLNKKEAFFGGQNTAAVFRVAAKKVPKTYFGENYTTIKNIFVNQLGLVENSGKNPNKAWKDAQAQVKRELSRH